MGHPNEFHWLSSLGSDTARQSSSGRQPNFAALNRGRHRCSAGRSSRWALAHILVFNNHCERYCPDCDHFSYNEPRAAGFRHASKIRTKATPCVEVWHTSNLRRLRLGEEKSRKKKNKLQHENIMFYGRHRASIKIPLIGPVLSELRLLQQCLPDYCLSESWRLHVHTLRSSLEQ